MYRVRGVKERIYTSYGHSTCLLDPQPTSSIVAGLCVLVEILFGFFDQSFHLAKSSSLLFV